MPVNCSLVALVALTRSMVAAESPEYSDAIGISVPRQLALSG